jgi:glucose/arabinose dehydrogenase
MTSSHPKHVFLLYCLLCLPVIAVSSRAATLPGGFTENLVASGISSPTAMSFAPDGRLFVCQQGGQLRVIKNGALLAAPFLTVTVDSSGERGLLGVAFDPNFATNQFVYIYYTVPGTPAHNRVSRFTASGDVAAPGSEVIILELNNLSSATNHNGGAIHFGPDEKLYIAVGDNANGSNAQTLNNLLGKMLRINANGTIPNDNPFFNQATGNNRAIWTRGLRNPYTFAFQPGTGRSFINDVGQSTWEEVNDGIAGSNYGWPTCEGACSNSSFRNPLYQYGHAGGSTQGCAISGGAFYNPPAVQFPESYTGKYFFADYCGGWINYLDPNNLPQTNGATVFATGLSSPVDLAISSDGSLYYLQRGSGGQVWRIQYTSSQAPVITTHPQSQTVSVGQPVTFTVTATGSAPLSFQWQRDSANIAGATQPSYTITSVTTNDNSARFRCVVSNPFGTATSNEAILTITGNQPPTATITAPPEGTLYSGGQVINYSGTGADPEDGTLPASAFTWQVDFHHDTHTHPFIAPVSGVTSGSFTIPTTGETSANVWYRIHLTVTDSGGLAHSAFRDILPRTVTLTLATNPTGLKVKLDGQPQTAPYSFVGVVGITRELSVDSPQRLNNTTYAFASWSDGGAQTHNISTPSANTTYTATFQACSYSISPTSRRVGPAAGTGTVSVTATSGCHWTAVSNASWITVTAGSSGVGNGTVSYSYAANTTGRQRRGTITIAGRTFTLTQTR